MSLRSFVTELRRLGGEAHHRHCLVLAGERDWAQRSAVSACPPEAGSLWIADAGPDGCETISRSQARSVLGSERDIVVYDAFDGFDPDAFGAVAGMIRAGGLMMLLTPPLDAWPGYSDPDHERIAIAPLEATAVTGRFLARLARILRESRDAIIIAQDQPRPALPAAAGPAHGAVSDDPDCRTADQATAVAAIRRVATGHRRRPAVLTSDRGRGKSAALGIAAARLLSRDGKSRIVVTAPRREAAAAVFEHAARLLPDFRTAGRALWWRDRALVFRLPDELAHEEAEETDLLLVDEAAAIPAPLLARLLKTNKRVAFATTVHGYEGTGRGFDVRFRAVLDRETPEWRAIRMETPVRFAAGDPLERLTFRLLCLDAEPAEDAALTGADSARSEVVRLDREALARDETLLGELFGLLVLAHYRTRPSDLRQLLDGPELAVYALRWQGHVAGAALVAFEGGFSPDRAWAIWAGTHRPRGHLIPETLAAHAGLQSAPCLRGARIMRIAVHPVVRRRGLGARLVAEIMADATKAGFDYCGASFGATADLLRFWSGQGFVPVRLGIRREAASGTHSAVCLKGLSAAGGQLSGTARARFGNLFPHQLADPVRDLEPDLAAALLRDLPAPPDALDDLDWLDLVALAWGERGYEFAMDAAWKLVRRGLADGALGPGPERDLLIARVCQRRQWAEVAPLVSAHGRRDTVAVLRRGLRRLCRRYAPTRARTEAARLLRTRRRPL